MPVPPTTPTRPRGDPYNMQRMHAVLNTPSMLNPDLGDTATNHARAIIAQAMNNEMFFCKHEDFMKAYGPALVPGQHVLQCRESLKHLITNVNGKDRWSAYTLSPKDMAGHEDNIFAHLQNIVDGIAAFAASKKQNSFIFKLVPGKNTTAHISGSNHKMDACIAECEWTGKLPSDIVVIPMEFKSAKNEKAQKNVREQIVGDCHHIMSDDARRMFIYALTVENNRASVWYFSRNHSVKAAEFDWVSEDINKLIELFLSFYYASPEALGLDPLVQKAPGGQFVYEFERPIVASANRQTRATAKEANKVFYLTQICRSPSRPACISGRITRIWEAIQVCSATDHTPAPNATPVIIKDVWLPAGAETEGENQDRFFADVDEYVKKGIKAAIDFHHRQHKLTPETRKQLEAEPKARLLEYIKMDPRCAQFDATTQAELCDLLTGHRYRSLFLNKILHRKGQLTKDRSKKATPKRDLFAPTFTEARNTGSVHRTINSRSNPTLHRSFDPRQTPEDSRRLAEILENRDYEPKRQHRFVYEEVCEELYKLKTVGDVMDMVCQAADGLRIMFLAGWIHRDISLGNILAYPVQRGNNVTYQVKIADLEFSQPMGYKRHSNDPRTGTPFFMAHELLSERYLIEKHKLVRGATVNTGFGGGHQKHLATQIQGLTAGTEVYEHFKRVKVHDALDSYTHLPAKYTMNIPPIGTKAVPNFQHDLESLWWIIIYVVTLLVGHKDSEDYIDNVFRHEMKPSEQRVSLLVEELDIGFHDSLHPRLRANSEIALLIAGLRDKLHERYLAMAVFGQLELHEAYSVIHGHFATRLRNTVKLNRGSAWRTLPVVNPAAIEGMKLVPAPQDDNAA